MPLLLRWYCDMFQLMNWFGYWGGVLASLLVWSCKIDYLGYRNDGKLEIMRVFIETRNY